MYTPRSMQVNETARKIAELERTIRELKGTVSELDLQIQSEEVRTRIFNPAAPGYSSFCRSARQRRENLCTSIIRLEVESGAARRELAQVMEQAKSPAF
jgi:flagellar protein FliJ